MRRLRLIWVWVATTCLVVSSSFAQTTADRSAPETRTEVVLVQGQASVLPAGAVPGHEIPIRPTPTNAFPLQPETQFQVGTNSRAVFRDQGTTAELGPGSRLTVQPSLLGRFRAFLQRGWFHFFHRDEPGHFELTTRTVVAAVQGTEFVMKVEEDRTTLIVLEGTVVLSNAHVTLQLTNGQSGIAIAGQPPTPMARLETTINEIQWCLYYPAVLDAAELGLRPVERQTLAGSLEAYRQGDLLAALRQYPAEHPTGSDAAQVYRAALLLAVGEVEQTEKMLAALPSSPSHSLRLAEALRRLIAAVKQGSEAKAFASQTATASEWLAESYYRQSRTNDLKALEHALEAAHQAVSNAPTFGFAWARVAELEFCFGRTERAAQALAEGLRWSPRNAQALAVKGFLLAARNHRQAALEAFEEAIAADPGLGNAWLGRGLCRISQSHLEEGRQDLQVAATLEPRRAFLRSYLGKAFSLTGDRPHAERELDLAKDLDPGDPTAWLYSALLKQQANRINEGIRELERSQELNDNRQLYRSRQLLDQDRAVQSANLADLYQDAGMTEVAVREATRSVQADYANYSAHLFLANSYDQLRDPNQVELRYETAWLNEYLLANLLAPAGAGVLSPTISQQEYSPLFERDGLGVVSSTEYLSRGAWTQAGAQYGRYASFAYSLEAFYRTDAGQRPNNDLEQRTLDVQLKQQITSQDHVYLQAITSDSGSGDLAQYYDPTDTHLGFRAQERQEPMLLAGYHRQWSPESHTLLLGGVLDDTLHFTDPSQPTLFLMKNAAGNVLAVPVSAPAVASLDYECHFSAVTLEGQQIWQANRHTLIAGTRYQYGDFDTTCRQGALSYTLFSARAGATAFSAPSLAWDDQVGFQRVSGYGYWNWQVIHPLSFTAGVCYDRLRYPENFRVPPIIGSEDSTEQVSPKAGFLLTPFQDTTVRGAFTHSLGGVSFDQSFGLEPTLVGGFNQAYRSLMPESVVGSLSAARFETWSLALDQKIGGSTYAGVQFEWLESDASQSVGTRDLVYTGAGPFDTTRFSSAHQTFDYVEENLAVTFDQLLGDCFAAGARYKASDAALNSGFSDVPLLGRTELGATLHQAGLHLLFHHSSGFFAQAEELWLHQSNRGYTPGLPTEDFWQCNLHAGFRFLQRRAELRLSLLNVGDQDYRLNPLNLTRELPRTRTLAASFRFHF